MPLVTAVLLPRRLRAAHVAAKPKPPTYEQIIRDLLRPATGPVPVAALTAQMLALRPSAAKDAQKGARQHVVDMVGRQ
jgi:hypothetical protein